MSVAIPVSFAAPYRKARATDSADAAFAAKVATVTEPTGDGVIDLMAAGVGPTWLMLVPFGTTAADTTFDVRVTGWRAVDGLWVPTILLQFTATLGTAAGVAGKAVTASHLFADTVSDPAAGMGEKGVNCQPGSPANNTPAHYLLDARGCPKVEVLFNVAGGAVSANCLVAKV